MANEKRKRQIAIGGLVEDNPLTNSATTLNSAGLAAVVGGITSTEHMAIVFDPDGLDGAPEIAYITALTEAATSGTIARGQEGTTPREHLRDTPWVHATTLRDIVKVAHTKYLNGSDYTVTSTSRTAIDATNLPFEGFHCEVGDVIECSIKCRFSHNAGGNPVSFDFEVDQPTSANVFVGDFPTSGKYMTNTEDTGSDYGRTDVLRGTYVVTERGTHTFRPVWRVGTGTGKIWQTGVYATPIDVLVKNLGPEVA